MAEFNPDITLEEFELLCLAVSVSVENSRRYADNSPNEEDEMVENMQLQEFLELQKKFPDPGMIVRKYNG